MEKNFGKTDWLELRDDATERIELGDIKGLDSTDVNGVGVIDDLALKLDVGNYKAVALKLVV